MPLIQKPSLVRNVIFTAARGQGDNKDVVDEYAAIITKVHAEKPGVVDLVTFGPNSVYFNHDVPHDLGGSAGTWRYPPFVEGKIEVER